MQYYIGLFLGLGVYLYSIFLLNSEKLNTTWNSILLCASVLSGVAIGRMGSSFMLPYYITQSISDKKEKKVYAVLNYVIIGCCIFYNGITWWSLLMCLGLFLLSFKFGSGDIKCLVAMCILLRQPLFHDSLFYLLLFLLVSELFFICSRIIKKTPKKERTAFFPAMFFSYGIMLILL